MSVASIKKEQRARRQNRVRARVRGTAERPRLSVFRSNRYLYVQIVNDDEGITLAEANTRDLHVRGEKAPEAAGKAVAEKCITKGVTKVVFDRGGFRYTGAIQKLADAARAAGLEF